MYKGQIFDLRLIVMRNDLAHGFTGCRSKDFPEFENFPDNYRRVSFVRLHDMNAVRKSIKLDCIMPKAGTKLVYPKVRVAISDHGDNTHDLSYDLIAR